MRAGAALTGFIRAAEASPKRAFERLVRTVQLHGRTFARFFLELRKWSLEAHFREL
jgi:hypothetical protein